MQAVLISPTPFTGVMLAQDAYKQSAMDRVETSAQRLAKDIKGFDLSSPKICGELLQVLAPISELITKATKARRLEPARVVLVVASVFGFTPEQIMEGSASRKREKVDVRHACFYYLSHYTSLSPKDIARYMMGDREIRFDRTTVLHGRDKVQDLIDTGEWRHVAKLIQDNLSI